MEQAKSAAWKIGGIIGVVAGLASLALGLLSFVPLCGCFTGIVNWALPAIAGLAGGGIAAFRSDWSEAPPGQGAGLGAGIGVRGGVVAAAVAALAYALVAFLSPFVGIVINAIMYGSSDQLVTILMASLVTAGIGIVINLGIAVVSTLVGLGLGAAAGAIVGASMGNQG